ncbi:MAG: glycosyltransferase family 39 protein [Anaerolineales bacterium]
MQRIDDAGNLLPEYSSLEGGSDHELVNQEITQRALLDQTTTRSQATLPAGDLAGGVDHDLWQHSDNSQRSSAQESNKLRILAIGTAIFLLAALPRLYVLFEVTDPQNPGLGWYGDVFHHWQIAYLSDEVGFSESFLRLWDFKGMEFFWGLLHPLVLIGLFTITGSVDIVILRLLSLLAASASIALLFFLLKRYFNRNVAIAGALIAALNPVAVFNDTVGMQEPLGLLLLFTGLVIIDRHPVFAGILWGLAGMVRAEYWVFGAGLVVVAFLLNKKNDWKIALGMGWAIPSLAYMKYLLDYTGNPIYPIYWNYLGGTAGLWMVEAPLELDQIIAQWTARIVLVVAAYAAIRILRSRPESTLVLMLGLGNIIMLGLVLGVGAYIYGYSPRINVDRLMVVPFMFVGVFVAIAVFGRGSEDRSTRARTRTVAGWLAVVALILGIQSIWLPLVNYYEPLQSVWAREVRMADEIGRYYDKGTISIPEDRPGLTYALVQYHGISGSNIDGQMYDAFAYISGDPFEDWDSNREIVLDWLEKTGVRFLVVYRSDAEYMELVNREPNMFRLLEVLYEGSINLYGVGL